MLQPPLSHFVAGKGNGNIEVETEEEVQVESADRLAVGVTTEESEEDAKVHE